MKKKVKMTDKSFENGMVGRRLYEIWMKDDGGVGN